ncbi:hypothetical protein F0562_031376 [Nyssa sinensis]|uniref:Myb/SANT-like domain-containing protein n=1 Tax=Nyssa sinensis TaxID=561372 RepID=A0A5J5ATZ6_9ASTE|nr:hypothetical protein F0562_031376 [Nyssa sinensis]
MLWKGKKMVLGSAKLSGVYSLLHVGWSLGICAGLSFDQILHKKQLLSSGRWPHSVWSKEAWRETCAASNLKFGTSYNVKVFKNRLTKLKDQYSTLKELIGKNGFGWDDHYHKVTAENSVWDEYILKHPKAKHFRGKTFPLHDRLGIIFEGILTEDRDPLSTRHQKVVDETLNETGNAPISRRSIPEVTEMDGNSVTSSDDETSSEQPIQNRTRISPLLIHRRVRRRRERVGYKIVSLLMDFLASHAGNSHAIQQEQPSAMSKSYSYAECRPELKRIDELDISEIVKGAHVLKDEQNRIAFMTFEGPARLAFLRSCFN